MTIGPAPMMQIERMSVRLGMGAACKVRRGTLQKERALIRKECARGKPRGLRGGAGLGRPDVIRLIPPLAKVASTTHLHRVIRLETSMARPTLAASADIRGAIGREERSGLSYVFY